MPKSEAQPVAVTDIHDLIARDLRLQEIRQYVLAAERIERVDGEAEVETDIALHLSVRGALGWMETRFEIVVTTMHAVIRSDLGVIYQFFEGADLSAEVQRDFIQKVAVMTAYPYLRESVSSLATRLGVPIPALGIMKQGEFEVGLPESIDS